VLEKREDDLLRMTRAVHRTLGWFAKTPAAEIAGRLGSYFPDIPTDVFAGAIDRYRKLELWGSDPVIRREGYDRLHAAMRAFGALSKDIAFDDCVDTSLAKRAMT
jgi:NitT/TauT family transport system substrate-binding protein